MNEINISTINTVPIPIIVFITALYIFCPVVYDGLIAPFSSEKSSFITNSKDTLSFFS